MEKERTAHDPKPRSMCQTWASVAANGIDSLLYIDDVIADRSSRMNSVEYRSMLSAHKLQTNGTVHHSADGL